METFEIKYIFRFPDGQKDEVIKIRLDAKTVEIVDPLIEEPPEWTSLSFEQCPNCPLSELEYPNCPLAIRLVPLADTFKNLLSYHKVRVYVVTDERMIAKSTTAQKAVSAIMGLVMPTSGCPRVGFFKPMARFHLPLATEEETIYRATSMYLLARYFLKKEGRRVDFELDGLIEIYENLQILNSAMARRVRAAVSEDAALNAIVLLDFFAKALPWAVEESLGEIRPLFSQFLEVEQEAI